jgi:hypothetical protein
MIVRQRGVAVRMAMWLARRISRPMRMLVMGIVSVCVLVLERLVLVPVGVALQR